RLPSYGGSLHITLRFADGVACIAPSTPLAATSDCDVTVADPMSLSITSECGAFPALPAGDVFTPPLAPLLSAPVVMPPVSTPSSPLDDESPRVPQFAEAYAHTFSRALRITPSFPEYVCPANPMHPSTTRKNGIATTASTSAAPSSPRRLTPPPRMRGG